MGRCVIAATNFKQLGNYVGDIIIRYQFIYIVIDRRRILGQQIRNTRGVLRTSGGRDAKDDRIWANDDRPTDRHTEQMDEQREEVK